MASIASEYRDSAPNSVSHITKKLKFSLGELTIPEPPKEDFTEAERALRKVEAYLASQNLKMDKRLGRGNFGEVYVLKRADTYEETDLVIKILSPGKFDRTRSDRGESLCRFLNNSPLSRSHCLYFQKGREENQDLLVGENRGDNLPLTAIIMPFVPGKILNTDSPVSPDEAAKTALAIVKCLIPLHQNNIAHRDLKPANIITQGNEAVLLDLGIARLYQKPDEDTNTPEIGTEAYMPPEGFQRGYVYGKENIGKGDIYSLGLILNDLLGGENPKDLWEKLDGRINLDRIDPRFHSLLKGMLHPEPAKRLSSIEVETQLSELVKTLTS